jgi:hypothetical protein
MTMKHRSSRLLVLLALASASLAPAWAANRQLPAAPPTAPPESARPGVPSAPSGPAALPTISLDEVKAGQRGYGLSVFAGSQPERFDVEVIGVMRNVSADNNYILARLTGHGLEKIGVASGMSGSPVFLDGRLAGAVAFSWPFSQEAIAGITPIGDMRRLSDIKGGIEGIPVPPPPVPVSALLSGKVPPDLFERGLARLRPDVGSGAVASVQWVTSGFGPKSESMLRQALGPNMATSSAGQAKAGAVPKDLQLGSAVAAVLVDGDFRMAAVGTVTDRYGDQVLAFGHPFLGLGPIRVPMATAEVLTVLSSQYSSFKITNLGDEVGSFEQDRKAGIQGRIGQQAPMIPMVLSIQGAGNAAPQVFHVRIADVPIFMSNMVSSTVAAALESTSYVVGAQGLDLEAHVRLRKYGDLEVHQSFDGDNAGAESVSFLMALSAYLAQNPFERLGVEGIDIRMSQTPQPRSATLVGANADHAVVHPGDTVGLNLDLVAFRGDHFRRAMKIDLPKDLPAGRYSLVVGDGASIDAVRLALAPAEPVSFAQALAMLRSFHSRRDLAAIGFYGGAGLSVSGEVMPRLPGSVRSLYSAASSGNAVPVRASIAQLVSEPISVPIDGMVRIDLDVRLRDGAGGETAPDVPDLGTGAGEVVTVTVNGSTGGSF